MIVHHPLPPSQYVQAVHTKNAVVIHHTAGGHRPDYTVNYWSGDTQRVGTAFVIGGKSITNNENNFDGTIIQAFDPKFYAFHLGVKGKSALEKTTIGIEICNYGPLRKVGDRYLNYVNKVVPEDHVCDLGFTWRGFRYFHKYTDAQISALAVLIQQLAAAFNIPVRKAWNVNSFDINASALSGGAGLWTHANYRKDKTDCSPQHNLIQMLNKL